MLAIGSAVIHNKGNMSSDITEITSLNNVKSGVGINNYGNLTGSLLVKANQIAFNNKNIWKHWIYLRIVMFLPILMMAR